MEILIIILLVLILLLAGAIYLAKSPSIKAGNYEEVKNSLLYVHMK